MRDGVVVRSRDRPDVHVTFGQLKYSIRMKDRWELAAALPWGHTTLITHDVPPWDEMPEAYEPTSSWDYKPTWASVLWFLVLMPGLFVIVSRTLPLVVLAVSLVALAIYGTRFVINRRQGKVFKARSSGLGALGGLILTVVALISIAWR